ncbi:MAG: hypothetical protein EXX96DRAFT_548426 [Benjaminiella poitrasii]|nr:MAG: hypothetical protein EXX96DRAFT_548426 [Benjaminiella poitrasii]
MWMRRLLLLAVFLYLLNYHVCIAFNFKSILFGDEEGSVTDDDRSSIPFGTSIVNDEQENNDRRSSKANFARYKIYSV